MLLAASFRAADGGYQADYAPRPSSWRPAGDHDETRLFAGAKEKALLDQYEDAGIPKLSKCDRLGLVPLVHAPDLRSAACLFTPTGNFGVAIICLTLIVRGIMFPIAQKQFQSMAAMRKVQPKMKAIQERFKDDKTQQQQEILKLYQSEKINPAAGCLPILLQIPVFYALYKVLMVSVEMRHQPFALWINDLSAADPLTPVNLFGLLHFTPPRCLPSAFSRSWSVQRSGCDEAEPAADGPGPSADFRNHALVPGLRHGAVRGWAAALLDHEQLLTIAQQWWLYRKYGLHLSDTHPVHT